MPAYSAKAQPFLDAIAESVFTSQDIRDWLIAGTSAEANYTGAAVLYEEQKAVRHKTKATKQPFWANYFCGFDSKCRCRVEGSKALESDAIFFFRNNVERTLAIHIEFKHPSEPFQMGQAESYPLRADCFAKTSGQRPALIVHDDWITVLFCEETAKSDVRCANFNRIITHRESSKVIPAYPR